MALVGLLLFLAIAGLLFLLVWLYFLYFDQPHRHSGWSKLPEEHMGILKKEGLNLANSFSNPEADFIKMGYGIVDEEAPLKKQYLFSLDEVQQQLDVPVHLPTNQRSDSPVPPPGTLRKVLSTDSLDSSTSSLMDCETDFPTVHLILTYDERSQMFSVQVERLTDVCSDLGHVWLLFFLLPHPKPLWRTAAAMTPASSVDYNCVYQQCIRKCDLPKIALLVQLYTSKQQQAAIGGQCRLRLKDVDLLEAEVPVSLALQPSYKEQNSGDVQLGELLFLMRVTKDTLTVVVSKLRNLDPEYKTVFVRLYVVLPLGKAAKKKTSQKEIINGTAEINETMFFNIPKKKLAKGSLRLSVVCGDQLATKSIGHITLNGKSSGKELGHWSRAFSEEKTTPTMRWHSLKPRRTRY